MQISRKVFWVVTVLCVLLTVWLGCSIYLRSVAPDIIYQTSQSKNEDCKALPDGATFGRDFLLNSKGEKIEILVIRNYQNYKSGTAILYLHGSYGRLPQILKGASQVETVFSPAYPGYSLSEGQPSEKSIYETVDLSLSYLLYRRKYQPNQITILGHSLGAAAALHAAIKYPELKKVVIVNVFYSMRAMCQIRYSMLCIFTGDIFNLAESAPLARAKIRQFHVLQDSYVPFEQGQKLFEKIGSKDKVFKAINGTHDNFDVAEVLKN